MTDSSTLHQRLRLFVHTLSFVAEGAMSVDLRAKDGSELPPFEAGAHVDLHLPGGLSRSYSLTNIERDRRRYVVCVGYDERSRGGSAYVHRTLRVGDELDVDLPRNHFRLVEDGKVVFIAGGIGVTPLYAMAQRMAALGAPFAFHLAARSARRASFVAELKALGDLNTHFDDEHAGAPLDLTAIVAGASPDTHLYCCGPSAMLDAFDRATQERNPDYLHKEYFAKKAVATQAANDAFEVVLAKSGKTVSVTPDKSILQALADVGVVVDSSCREGICGTCETRVVSGEIDHRDSVLSDREKAAGKSIMVCVSRCKGERLVLDI